MKPYLKSLKSLKPDLNALESGLLLEHFISLKLVNSLKSLKSLRPKSFEITEIRPEIPGIPEPSSRLASSSDPGATGNFSAVALAIQWSLACFQ